MPSIPNIHFFNTVTTHYVLGKDERRLKVVFRKLPLNIVFLLNGSKLLNIYARL